MSPLTKSDIYIIQIVRFTVISSAVYNLSDSQKHSLMID